MDTRGGCAQLRYNPAVLKYMPDPTEPNENAGPSAVASYVATMSADLATMARKTGLDTLGYLLEMVRLEAESVTRHNVPNGRRADH
jgi:hypothetical protein